MAKYDVVIIGAGHNGLSCACTLAREGLRVLVLERREMVGGMCVTEEIFKNFRYDTGAFYPYWVKQQVVDQFQLASHGLEFIDSGGIDYTALFPDGTCLTIYESVDKTAKEIGSFSQKDARSYVEFVTFWKKFRPIVDAFMLAPPPLDFLKEFAKPLPIKLGLLKMFGRLPPGLDQALNLIKEPRNLEALAEFLFKPITVKLDELFESEKVRLAFIQESLEVSLSGPSSTPMTALVWRTVMKERSGRVKGGMGNFSAALRLAAEEAGAQVETSAEVEKIVVRDGSARGVKLKDGREVEARIVASNADPRRTFLGLVGEENFDGTILRKIKNFKLVATGLRLNYAVSERPNFGIPDDRYTGPLMHCPSIEYAETAFYEAALGRPPENPLILLDIPTEVDSTLAPRGAHIVQSVVNPMMYSPKGTSWDQLKEAYADKLTEKISSLAPNFKHSVMHRLVQTPLDLERRFYATNGDVEHGDLSWYQLIWFRPMLGYHDGRTPIRNLYLVGGGIHPSGAVRCLPGMMAGATILGDLRHGKVQSVV